MATKIVSATYYQTANKGQIRHVEMLKPFQYH